MFKPLLLVFLGGGLGSCLRYLLGKLFNTGLYKLPLGTLIVNILGCFLIGILGFFFLHGKQDSNYLDSFRILLIGGFLGGFTTFSSFAFEGFNYLKKGELLTFVIYALASLVFGLVAVALGYALAKKCI